jgi:hypothetical protein
MSVPYFAHFFVEVPLAHRFLLFVAFYLQLALVWLILRVLDEWRSSPGKPLVKYSIWATHCCLTILFVSHVSLAAIEFFDYTYSPKFLTLEKKNTEIPASMSVVDLYAEFTAPLPESAVVLATARVGWPLPTVKAKVVSLFHENPTLLDQDERYLST